MPAFYILRRPSEPLPAREKVAVGDVVVLHSGDIMVYDGEMWYLLPGRYLTSDQIKVFVGYVASGWPDQPDLIGQDLADLGHERFLSEMTKVAERIVRSRQPASQG
jgi:hypothetical protein